ncbi:MAG TPA: 23S rRNA (uracil(1939)-C(5))-methyltransferase RlmD [Candidatus Acidoferrales bacterium]|nr:23S rRNA (uracil(1939)-C(5))-methyltransferase RlmD [Candidatus Acidoferrales bacterium]
MRVKIEKLVYGGEGLAHANGEAVFVPFVLPGEEVEIEAEERKKKFVRGRLTRVVKASPERVDAQCPHFGICGGCDYQHISYEAQLRYKEQILRETLRRLGRIDWTGAITVHASPPWQYRNRAQWKVRPLAGDRASTSLSRPPGIGYFRAGSSTLCPVEVCPILSPKLFATFEALRIALREGKLPETLREVEAFVDAEDHGVLLNISCTSLPRAAESIAQMLSERIEDVKSILIQDARGERMSLHGPGFLQYKVAQNSFRVGHMSFFQVNRFLVEEMASVVAAAGTGEVALDLYAGVGLFAISLAKSFTRVEAVEANPASARDLETNAGLSGKTIAARNDSTEAFLAAWKRKRGVATPDAVIADPPRAGIEPEALDKLIEIAPQRIVYVSCDPSTLARDLAKLSAKAYALRELYLFDMFPQTYHIEAIARLERVR